MSRSRQPAPPGQPRRWLALLLASALLHGTVLNLTGWQIGIPAPVPEQSQRVVTAQLRLRQLPQPAASPAPPRAVPPAGAKPRPTPKPVAAAFSAPAISAAASHAKIRAQALALAEQAADQMIGMEVPGSSIEPAIVLVPDQSPAAQTGPDAGSAPALAAARDAAGAPQRAIDPPPPVLLKYEVQSSKDGKAIYGSGKIAWHTDGAAYAVSGEASVLFFNVLEFRSEGAIDRFGVAPLLYTEKRLRKPATNTHFRREPQIVSFSASTLTYPRQGGEQDRASISWQLAALGRGDSSLFAPGAQIEVMVAGVRDAETWRIRVVGLEQLKIPAGDMQAWHLVRQPRAASFDQIIDIWLAPQQQWYPVRLRYTDHNGDYLDMAASVIEPGAPPSTSLQEQ